MKIKQPNLSFLIALFFGISCAMYSQNENEFNFEIQTYETVSVIETIKSDVLNDLELNNDFEEEMSAELFLDEQDPVQTLFFIRNMLALGAGIGFGDSQTLWCLHAAYYMRFMMFKRSALYGSLGVVYEGSDINDSKANIFDIQLKILMFTAISKMMEIRMIYGPMFAYGFGSQKYSGFKDNLTQFTASFIFGFQLMIAAQWSLALQTNLLTYQKQTWKQDGGGSEFSNDSTFGFINKNNILALSLYLHLGGGSR